jgi:hypothetical protein
MCEHWWDERLLKEQVEKLKHSKMAPAPAPTPEKQEKPERKPQNQPDPVPV